MVKNSPIINILTFGLPFKLANQIFNEYHDRLREVNFILENSPKYSTLKDVTGTLEILLALSIFHKRVISNLDGAVKFYKTVRKYSASEIISIGSYDLDLEEKNKILALLINYRKLIVKFGMTETIMDYYYTKDFLKKILYLKSDFEDNETSELADEKGGEKSDGFWNQSEEDDLPF